MHKKVLLTLLIVTTSMSFSHHSNGTPTSEASTYRCPGDKRALAISGGGLKGAYQVGAVWYLVNVLECNFDHFFGTSTGALSSAILSGASNHAELKERVELLLNEYLSLRDRSMIIDERWLGKQRFFLPSWLGGVDGAATLEPLERRLRIYIKDKAVPKNLTVMVVSLQAGPLNPAWQRVDNIYDLVIGSASIPIAITPRAARVWTTATPLSLEEDVLTLAVYVVPGLPDEECELQLSAARRVRCAQIPEATELRVTMRPRETDLNHLPNLSEDDIFVSASVKLRLPGLSPEDRSAIDAAIERHRKGPAGRELPRSRNILFEDPLAFWPSPKFEFTSVHQLIDGGVAENLPLERAIGLVSASQNARVESYDTVFALLAGRTPPVDTKGSRLSGGVAITGAVFEIMWESFQNRSLRSPERYLMFYRELCRSLVSTDELQKSGTKSPDQVYRRTGPGSFVSIAHAADRCRKAGWDKWSLITIDPGDADIRDPLEVEPGKIVDAIKQGCARAAQVAFHHRMRAANRSFQASDVNDHSRWACQPLQNRLTLPHENN